MIEVDNDRALVAGLQNPGDAAPVRQVELDHIARRIFGLRIRVLVERSPREGLHERTVAFAECLGRHEIEVRLLALCEPQQAGLERVRQMTGPDLHGGGPMAEGANDLALVLAGDDGQPVVQRHMRSGSDLVHGNDESRIEQF